MLRRWTIGESAGTTSCVLHVAGSAVGSMHVCCAFCTRSYADGACGIEARITAWASVRSLSVHAEVALRRGGHPVGVVAVVVLVEVRRHDPLLARSARVGLRDADRLDDLLDLAAEREVGLRGAVGGQQALADELLGDRGAAARACRAAHRARTRGCPTGSNPALSQKVRSSAAVVASDEHRRDLVPGHDRAVELAEGGQLDLAGPVVDHGLLGQLDLLEERGVGKALAERHEHADGADGPGQAEERQHREQEQAHLGGRAHAAAPPPGAAGDARLVRRRGQVVVVHRAQECPGYADRAAERPSGRAGRACARAQPLRNSSRISVSSTTSSDGPAGAARLLPDDQLADPEHHKRDDEELDERQEEGAVADRNLGRGVAGVLEHDLELREVDPAEEVGDRRHDDVLDQGVHHGAQGDADDDADGQGERVGLGQESLELAEHGWPPS